MLLAGFVFRSVALDWITRIVMPLGTWKDFREIFRKGSWGKTVN